MKKIFAQIENLKTDLWMQGIRPRIIFLSSLANEQLLKSLSARDGKKHRVIFEICGLVVKVDPECPAGGAYITGEEQYAATRESGN